MKIEGYIQHPRFKITIFKSGFRYIVKFETPEFEQSIKLRDGAIQRIEEVHQLVDRDFIKDIEDQFALLAKSRDQAIRRMYKSSPDDWEEII